MKRVILVLIVIITGLLANQSIAASTAAPKTVVQTHIEYRVQIIKVNQNEPIEMTVTAYDSGFESTGKHPGDKEYGITFSGEKVKPGTCAADLSIYPLHTSLYVEGYGYCEVLDKGSAIKGQHIDVYVPTLKQANAFGKQTLKVWILNDYGEE